MVFSGGPGEPAKEGCPKAVSALDSMNYATTSVSLSSGQALGDHLILMHEGIPILRTPLRSTRGPFQAYFILSAPTSGL